MNVSARHLPWIGGAAEVAPGATFTPLVSPIDATVASHFVESDAGVVDAAVKHAHAAYLKHQDETIAKRVEWLMTIPGIGECSAMMVLAEIGDIGRFHDKEAQCSDAGLVPRVRESAGKAARGGITRHGSPWLRWMMVEAAQVATRSSPAARRYYERLLRKKHKHVARVALARKLLIGVYVLLHDGEVFNEDKFAAV